MDVAKIIKNIDIARKNITANTNVRDVVIVSGSAKDRDYWRKRLLLTSPYIFNADGKTRIFSFEEKIGEKVKEGNFLGTLLAYSKYKRSMAEAGRDHRGEVTLMGMLFGRGERMSPFTQIEGNCKAAIAAASICGSFKGVIPTISEIEESLMFFAPIAKYIEDRGFKGILNKWGDETEIAAIDLSANSKEDGTFSGYDMIKFVSTVKVTDSRAEHKDWVAYDADNNMLSQISRAKKDILLGKLKEYGVRPSPDGEYRSGVSLGPVAVSYDVLDIALEVFGEEIKAPGVILDFDPYVLKAFAFRGDKERWTKAMETDRNLRDLAGPDGAMPDLFDKVCTVNAMFRQKYGRDLNVKVLDMGEDVFWTDIGQHDCMRKKYMSLNDKGEAGDIARKIEGIMSERDADGNIIIESDIGPDVMVKDSIVIKSKIYGTGVVEKSVIKDSQLKDVDMKEAFAVLSYRSGKTTLMPASGIYRSIGDPGSDLFLEKGMRHGTLLTGDGPVDMMVSEDTDLRDKEHNYNIPVFGNKLSFSEAYDLMEGFSYEDLIERKIELFKNNNERDGHE